MKFNFEVLPFCKQIGFTYINNGFLEMNFDKRGRIVPIPLPVIDNIVYAPNRYLKAIIWFNRLKCIRLSNNRIYIPEPFNLVVNFHHFQILATEFSLWKKYYAPPNPNEIILDAGAGYGETAHLYYRYFSPKSVISIEPNKERFEYLKRNSKSNAAKWPNHVIINDILRPEHFETDYLGLGKCTFAKIDIEGAEKDFIDYKFPPFVMEAHLGNIELYLNHGYKKLWTNNRGYTLVSNIGNRNIR